MKYRQYYVSKIIKYDNWSLWFPTTYIYYRESGGMKLHSKMKLKRHFDKIKAIFNVGEPEKSKELVNTIKSDQGYSGDLKEYQIFVIRLKQMIFVHNRNIK